MRMHHTPPFNVDPHKGVFDFEKWAFMAFYGGAPGADKLFWT